MTCNAPPLPFQAWNLGTIPRESSEPQTSEGRAQTMQDRVEQLERRMREMEEVYRQGFLERTLQMEYVEERLRELEAREDALDQMLSYGPIPGERVCFTFHRDAMVEPDDISTLVRVPVSFYSRPIYFGVSHSENATDEISVALNGYDPVADAEFAITPVELSTDSASVDPRVQTVNAVRMAYFNAAADFDLETQLGDGACLLPPDSYYEIDVTDISPSLAELENVTFILVLKQIGTIEQMTV